MFVDIWKKENEEEKGNGDERGLGMNIVLLVFLLGMLGLGGGGERREAPLLLGVIQGISFFFFFCLWVMFFF